MEAGYATGSGTVIDCALITLPSAKLGGGGREVIFTAVATAGVGAAVVTKDWAWTTSSSTKLGGGGLEVIGTARVGSAAVNTSLATPASTVLDGSGLVIGAARIDELAVTTVLI